MLKNLDNRVALATRDITVLADELKKNTKIVNDISNGKNYNYICEKFPQFVPLFNEFLEKHGYTSDFNCYCLYAKSFLENKDQILHIIRPLLKLERAKENKEQYAEIMQKINRKLGMKKYSKFKNDVEHLRYFHVVREESQYMWETAFYIMRNIIARACFLTTGDQNYFNSLAYLFKEEVISMLRRGKLSDEDNEKINRRKQKRPLAEKVWERAKLLVFDDTGEILKGVSGSTGQAIGKVCIINGAEEFYKLEKGDVLVCRLTDPEWTPLFTLASAVVADTGAGLSHAAIVAREYGIPAVLGVGFATSKFKDGDIIRVDGTKGEVVKVS